MATVTRHLQGSRLNRVFDGWRYSEVIRVAAAAGASLAEAQYAALIDASTPARGDTLVLGVDPDDITLFFASSTVRSTPVPSGGGLDVYLDVLWSNVAADFPDNSGVIGGASEPDDDGSGLVTVGSVVETVQTEFDATGAEIVVQKTATSPEIIQAVNFRRPRPVIEFSRWEQSSPRTRAETFVGKLNDALWNGYAAGTVLCVSIVGTSRDGGLTYDVRYEFEFSPAPKKWTETAVFIDPDTGAPPSGLVDGVSKVTVDLYEEVSFTPLAITL